jgi:hypothetical protein
MNGLPKTASGQIVFTTIQTWHARKNTDFAGQAFDLVVIDELHWGEEAPLYDALYDRYGGSCTFVGLTATPRRWTQYERVGRAYDLPTLVGMRYLAEPRLQVIRTGVNWRPRRTNEHGDVTEGSLRQLAMSGDRNRLVVSTYAAQAREYGKTIVFACNIAHADELAEMLVARGVRAAAMHSNMNDVDRMSVVTSFRRSDIDVLVNVVTAVHGLDVPDIRTVMLARPTASDILMSQMIGRGARLAPGKDFFYLVDFVDNADVHGGVPLVRPDGFIGSRLGPGARGRPLSEHGYETAALTSFPKVEGYEALEGLLLQPEQTFGIEFELSVAEGPLAARLSTDWATIPFKLLEALRQANLPTAPTMSCGHGPNKDNSVWNVEPDGSCDWEVTSRILRGFAGFIEIADACKVISGAAEQLGLKVSVHTGTHVHLGWARDAAKLRHLVEISAYFEPALLSLVAPSRADNEFTRSVRPVLKQIRGLSSLTDWATFLLPHDWRYLAVNARNLFHGYGTVEIRMHSGTLEGPKILTWLSLWMAIFAAAEEKRPLPGNPARRLAMARLCSGARGNVAALAEYVGSGVSLREKLIARRDFVVSRSWARIHPRLVKRLQAAWRRDMVRQQERASDAAAE